MLSRHAIFALCCITSLLVHGAFFYIAPRVTLFDTPALPRPILRQYKIQLEERARTEAVSRLERPAPELASRPGSIRDLLERDDSLATPLEEDGGSGIAPVPELLTRVAEESLQRSYELSENPALLERIDTRILEIAEQTARDEVQVARRLVRPSPDRILPRDALPVLRGETRPGGGLPLSIIAPPMPVEDSAGNEAAAEAVVEEALPQELEKPAFEEGVVAPEIIDVERIEPLLEEIIARAPIEREIQEIIKERDFEVLDDLVDFKLDAYAPPGEAMGYFRLRILPRSIEAIAPLPKDVTFVIDASKSISQHKLNATAEGVKSAIAQLRPEDFFNVVVFRSAPVSFQAKPVAATPENKAAARTFLQRLDSSGETDVYKAIHTVIEQSPREGVPGLVLLISDGRPTTGMRDGRTIINGLTRDNGLRNSIFTFAGGRTVNRYLLDLLAYRNKGESHVVDTIDEIPKALPAFFARYQAPLLLGLRADYGRIDEASVYPRTIPDFYRDRPVTIYGRYDRLRDKDFVMCLTGRAMGQSKEVIFRANFEAAGTGDQSISRNWAFEKSYHIIGQMVTSGETPELREELRALGLRYNIRTSYSE